MDNLQNELSKMFKEDLKAVFKKEQGDKKYLPQKDFDCCYDRAEAGIKAACERVTRTLAMAIAKHREEEHGDDTAAEQESLTAEMGSYENKVSTQSVEAGWLN